MKVLIEDCDAYQDNRGDLVQFLTNNYLHANNLQFGQVYLLTFQGKDIVRGNHYHYSSSEVFCLISGEVEMIFEDILSKERMNVFLPTQNKKFKKIMIGEKVAHAIKSISEFAVLVSFSSHEYSVYDEDKHEYILI